MTTIRVVSSDRRFHRDGFNCGRPSLDEWLRTQAGQQERRDNCRTVLAVDDADRIVGYATLVNYRLDLDEVAAALEVGRHRYPMPALLLARLAVSRDWQRAGVGGALLEDVLRRATAVGGLSGCQVLVVDAINDEAVTYYARHGFTRFRADPRRLYMAMGTVRATLAALDSSP